jgi:putative DNA primase/helicase
VSARAQYEEQLQLAGCEHPDGGYRCPSSRHRKPIRLSIHETPVGVMLKCAGNCEADEITGALQAKLDEFAFVEEVDGDDQDAPSDFTFPEEWSALEDLDLDDEQTKQLLKFFASGKSSPATVAVELAEKAHVVLFHDEGGNCYGTFELDGHAETHPITSRSFRGWLGRLYYADRKTALPAAAVADAIALLSAKATYDVADPVEVHLRVARDLNRIVVDLGDPQWRAVSVTRKGWEILDRHPVRFRRSSSMAALPEPRRGGKLEAIGGYLNLADDDQYRLVVAWLVAALRPGAPFPVLSLTGTAGSAKSSAAKMLRSLVDPNRSPLRAPRRDDVDLMVYAVSSWVCAYDNMSEIPQSMSDALCRLSTGGGLGKRMLYSDGDEFILEAMRPVILTSIASAVTRGDLVSRAIMLDLRRIPEHRRRKEEELMADFEGARPALFGALLDTLVGVLDVIDDLDLEHLPRMADFATVGVAVERVLGWEAGSFMASYSANIRGGDALTVEHSPVGAAIQKVAEAGGFTGRMQELLDKITVDNPDQMVRAGEWPKTTQKLAAELKRITPNLLELGVDVEHAETLIDGYRVITIRAVPT